MTQGYVYRVRTFARSNTSTCEAQHPWSSLQTTEGKCRSMKAWNMESKHRSKRMIIISRMNEVPHRILWSTLTRWMQARTDEWVVVLTSAADALLVVEPALGGELEGLGGDDLELFGDAAGHGGAQAGGPIALAQHGGDLRAARAAGHLVVRGDGGLARLVAQHSGATLRLRLERHRHNHQEDERGGHGLRHRWSREVS